MPTTPPAVTALPTPPSRSDPANFPTRGDAFLTALPVFQTQNNAVATNVFNNADEALTSANSAAGNASASAASLAAAQTAAQDSAAASNAPAWISGATYALGAVVYSTVARLTYRRIVAGAGVTDPASDTTNWAASAQANALGLQLIHLGVF